MRSGIGDRAIALLRSTPPACRALTADGVRIVPRFRRGCACRSGGLTALRCVQYESCAIQKIYVRKQTTPKGLA